MSENAEKLTIPLAGTSDIFSLDTLTWRPGTGEQPFLNNKFPKKILYEFITNKQDPSYPLGSLVQLPASLETPFLYFALTRLFGS